MGGKIGLWKRDAQQAHIRLGKYTRMAPIAMIPINCFGDNLPGYKSMETT